VRISEGEVEVTLRGEKDFVVLETHNRGTPIPREVLSHVFEPGRAATIAPAASAGIFIVQQNRAGALGGSIEVRSSESEGTTFTVALPRKGRQKRPQ